MMMNNDLDRVTRMAEECGGFDRGDHVQFFKNDLLAFKQAVLAKHSDDLNRLNTIWIERYEQLQAKLAMQAEALEVASLELDPTEHGQNCDCDPDVGYVCPCCIWVNSAEFKLIKTALNTTQADVDNWMAKKKAEWEKGVLLGLRQKVTNKTADWGWCVEVMIDEMIERGGVR